MATPDAWKSLWNQWDIRSFVFISLLLQTFLFLAAPLRKRTSSSWVIIPLWLTYLLADWVADYALGLIASSNDGSTSSFNVNKTTTDDGLLAFWATFLLSHLGGQDKITASALEDNELWRRHVLNFTFASVGVFYVFIQTLPVKENLWIPTTLMFITGFIKYFERTRSLYLASGTSFRKSLIPKPDPGPDYAKLMDVYKSNDIAGLPMRIIMLPQPDRVPMLSQTYKKGELTDLQVVHHAYIFFEAFKRLAVDLRLSIPDRNDSREFFLARSPKDAFRVVEVELNFLYEVLFTKYPVVYNRIGYCFRLFSSFAVFVSLVFFYQMEKMSFQGFDVGFTYTLLAGAIVLDVIGYIMLAFSNWTFILLSNSPHGDKSLKQSISGKIRSWLLQINIIRFKSTGSWFTLPRMHRSWGESISTFSLLHYCLHKRPRKRELVFGYLGLTNFLDEIWYVDCTSFTLTLRDFIFTELKEKSEIAYDLDTAKEITLARGEWVLRTENYNHGQIRSSVVDVDYDESLLQWHIATEICYNDKEDEPLNKNYRIIAKMISDYMIYLLVMRPDTMAGVVSVGLTRFQDTCADAERFFSSKQGPGKPEFKFFGRAINDSTMLQRACESILAVDTVVKPVTLKGDKSKSVLFDAAMLAKELIELPHRDNRHNIEVDKWFIVSKVWVEMLSYAARGIRADSHTQQLSKGGDLITIVWLLMAHFGLAEEYQLTHAHERAKLVVGK